MRRSETNSHRALALLVVVGGALGGCGAPPRDSDLASPTLTGIRFLGGPQADGFSRAMASRRFEFPADHGEHPGYRSEWWYFSGNLRSADARHYGFELTFFRYGLAAQPALRESRWATDAIWMAHFALTDIAERRFVAAERLSRGALALAGATAQPFRVWVEDWSAEGDLGAALGPVRLRAATAEAAIDLELRGFDRIVLQGEQGLDRKGPEPGNASYYYSAPRLAATGTVASADGELTDVVGLAWLDREWGTSALSGEVVGWDWFALQLADGRDLMFYRLREADGTASPFSGGSLTDPAGNMRRLGSADVELEVNERWQSPASGATYPIAWRMRIPAQGLELTVIAAVRDQELRLAVRYWEGAVEVSGRDSEGAVAGRGYLELAGY
jgi:predicted secreted hydrolase